MFDFGKQLKELRKARGLTQEQAAELLNVSKQSVSRWENNTTCPDIAFLPTLASFYGITVDSLLGADEKANAQIKKQYFDERQVAHRVGDIQSAFELSQKLYSQFPNDKAVINDMMVDSYLMGFHNVNGKRNHYLEMSIFISERFLKMTEDMEESCRCIRNIATCHKLLGNGEAAVRWMNKLPSMWSGVEHTALSVLEGQEKVDSIQCSLDSTLNLLYRLIFATAEETPLSQRAAILEKIPALFQLMFEQEDYGFYHVFLCRTYLELAKCHMTDREKALAYLAKSAAHALEVDRAVPCAHTSVLFAHHAISPEEWSRASSKNQSEQFLNWLEDTVFDDLREDAAFATILRPFQ